MFKPYTIRIKFNPGWTRSHPAYNNFARHHLVCDSSAARLRLFRNMTGLRLAKSRRSEFEYVKIDSPEDELAWSAFCLEWS